MTREMYRPEKWLKWNENQLKATPPFYEPIKSLPVSCHYSFWTGSRFFPRSFEIRFTSRICWQNFTCNSIFNAVFSRIAIGLIPVLVRPLTVNKKNSVFLHNLRKHKNRLRFSMDCLLKHDGSFSFNTVSGIWLPICLTSRNQKRVNSSIGM